MVHIRHVVGIFKWPNCRGSLYDNVVFLSTLSNCPYIKLCFYLNGFIDDTGFCRNNYYSTWSYNPFYFIEEIVVLLFKWSNWWTCLIMKRSYCQLGYILDMISLMNLWWCYTSILVKVFYCSSGLIVNVVWTAIWANFWDGRRCFHRSFCRCGLTDHNVLLRRWSQLKYNLYSPILFM